MSEQKTGIRGFIHGLAYPVRGARFLMKTRRVWRHAMIPLLINGVALVGLLTAGLFLLDDVYARLLPDWANAVDVAWYRDVGHWLMRALVGVGSFLITAGGALISAFLIASLLAGPFNEFLSEAVESAVTGVDKGEPLDPKQLGKDVARGLAGAATRMALWLAMYVPLALGSLVPGIGVFFAAGTIVYSMFFLGINFTDPVLDRKRLKVQEKLNYSRAHLSVHLGFGAGIFVMALVPGLALVVAPALVAGGTLLFLDEGGLPAELAAKSRERGTKSA